jgi:signal transduction histidine kinase
MNLNRDTVQKTIVWGFLGVTFLAYLLMPFLAQRWAQIPFPGFFFDVNMVINSNGAASDWPSRRLEIPISHPDRLIAIDGRPVNNTAEVTAILESRQLGDSVQFTLERPLDLFSASDEISLRREETVQLIAFSPREMASFFWASYLVGLTILVIGAWTFRARPDAEAARIFALFTVSAAWGVGGVFEFTTTQWFTRFWITGVIFSGSLNLWLTVIFPQQISWIRRWPHLRWLILLPAILIWVGAQWTLVDPQRPWFYVYGWRAGYILTGVFILISLAVIAYRAWFAETPLVRQQGRVMFGGAFVAFLPIISWLFFFETVSFVALFHLTPIVVYPLTIGYTIIRYRLLNLENVLRRGLTYLLLIAGLAAVMALLAAFWSISVGPMVAFTNPLLLAFIALLLALVIVPLRDRLQSWIDQALFSKPVSFDRLLRSYNRELTTAVHSDEVAKLLQQQAQAGLPDCDIALYLPDAQMSSYSPYKQDDGLTLTSESPLIAALRDEAGAIFLGELHTWPTALHPHEEIVRQMAAAVLAPITNGRLLWGWLAVSSKRTGERFSQLELNYLSDLADQSILGLERADVIRRLEDRVAQLDQLSQFSQALNFTIEFDDLLELVYTHCQRLLHVHDFFVVIQEPNGMRPYYAFWLENDERLSAKEGPHQVVADERVLQVLQTGQMTVKIMDDGRQCVAAPLNAGADTLGLLIAHAPNTAYRFAQRQRQLFSVYADRAATVLDRWLANQQVLKRAEQLTTLNELIGTLTSTLDVEKLLELILDKSLELLESEAGSFLLADEDTGELTFRVARGPNSESLLGSRLPLGAGLAGAVAQSGQPMIVNSVQDDQRWFGRKVTSDEFVTQSILTVPLLRYRQVMGVLQIINKRSGAIFTEEDQALMTAFAGQAVVALENARLLYQTDVALQNRVQELSLLQQLDRDLNNTLELNAVINLTLDSLLRLCDGTAGAVVLIENTTDPNAQTAGRVILAATRGYNESFDPEAMDSETLRSGLVGKVLASGHPHMAKNVYDHENYIAAAFETRSQLTIPLTHKQNVIGAVAIESDKEDAFHPQVAETAIRVTDHAAVAIANALLYSQVNAANRAKSEFVSMVSHELKTPMTSIRGYTDLMLSGATGPLADQQKNFLETIRANVRRMGTLIQDLTDISRIETGHLHIEPSIIAFASVVSETLQLLQGALDEKKMRLHTDVPANLPLIYADQARLVQVLTNLLSNACKYSPPETDIYLTVRAEIGDKLAVPMMRCTVRDTGYGISPEDQAKLFTKFFRASDSNIRQSPGTGLGLSITKGIVELHGGEISFESEVGQGTAFHFTAPLAQ